MGRETPAPLGRRVVVKSYRKFGNGAIGGGRKGQTGKMGIIYQIDELGNKLELARHEQPTFTALSQKLFDTKYIPRYVAIKKNGVTDF